MDTIYIVDFGGQYAHLISNRIRRLGVFTRIVLNDTDLSVFKDAKGIILSGGPQSVYEKKSPKINPKIFELKIPILGICYGHQYFAHHFGGKIGREPEYGKANLEVLDQDSIFKGVKSGSCIWENHGDAVVGLPNGFKLIASTESNQIAAMQNSEKKWFSVQFHPEVTHSGKAGRLIFKNFIQICGARKSWNMKKYLTSLEQEIKDHCKDKNVFLLVSGGVDSTVCFALLNKVLGKNRVFGLHIDTGFMRKNESELVLSELKKKNFDNLVVFSAKKQFFQNLKNIYNPEEKRKIIGETYLKIKDEALRKYDLNPEKWLLAQGTIYPDTIESGGTKNADTIKTHHNRVDQITELIKKGLIVEPLKELYKDEVRELGKILKISPNLINRHPFPGPGLAIRALCYKDSLTDNFVDINKKLHLFNNEFEFDVLKIKSVGIKGDARSYAYPVVLSGKYNYLKMTKLMTLVTNQFLEINRVLYNVSNSDIKKGNFKEQYLKEDYIELLQDIDFKITKILRANALDSKIWQCPIVIIPFGSKEKPYSMILRPIESIDAMSASAFKLTDNLLKEIDRKVRKKYSKIFTLFYDLTSKPPGTIEWE